MSSTSLQVSILAAGLQVSADGTLQPGCLSIRSGDKTIGYVGPPPPAPAQLIEEMWGQVKLVSEDAARLYALASDRSRSVDQRMREIYALYHPALGWTSEHWRRVLSAASRRKVSPQAVRKTDWWREDRARLRGCD